MPGLDEQGVWEERNKVPVSGRTEMRGKVIEEVHGVADQAGPEKCVKDLGPSHREAIHVFTWVRVPVGNLPNDQSV